MIAISFKCSHRAFLGRLKQYNAAWREASRKKLEFFGQRNAKQFGRSRSPSDSGTRSNPEEAGVLRTAERGNPEEAGVLRTAEREASRKKRKLLLRYAPMGKEGKM